MGSYGRLTLERWQQVNIKQPLLLGSSLPQGLDSATSVPKRM